MSALSSQYDIGLDFNCFNKGENADVVRGEHDDPRELVEDVHRGVGYHSPLTEVVEKDESTDEDSSSEVASSGDSG